MLRDTASHGTPGAADFGPLSRASSVHGESRALAPASTVMAVCALLSVRPQAGDSDSAHSGASAPAICW